MGISSNPAVYVPEPTPGYDRVLLDIMSTQDILMLRAIDNDNDPTKKIGNGVFDAFETDSAAADNESTYSEANDEYTFDYAGSKSVGSIDMTVTDDETAELSSFTVGGVTAISGAPIDISGSTDELLLHMDDADLTDSGVSSLTTTAVGNAARNTSDTVFGGGSLELDGTGDYLSVAASSNFAFGTGDLQIDWWAQRDGAGESEYNEYFFSQSDDVNDTFLCLYDPTVNTVYFYLKESVTYLSFVIDLEADTNWRYYKITRKSGVWKAHVNGVEQTLTNDSIGSNNIGYASNDLLIGAYKTGTTYSWNGKIDEFHITTTDVDDTTAVPTSAYPSNPHANVVAAINAGPLASTWDASTDGTTITLTADANGDNNDLAIAASGTDISFSNAVDTAGGVPTSPDGEGNYTGILRTADYTVTGTISSIQITAKIKWATTGIINTNITGWVSKNGGNEYTQVTLEESGMTMGDYILYRGTVSVAGQAAGTTLKAEIRAAGDKQSHCAALAMRALSS